MQLFQEHFCDVCQRDLRLPGAWGASATLQSSRWARLFWEKFLKYHVQLSCLFVFHEENHPTYFQLPSWKVGRGRGGSWRRCLELQTAPRDLNMNQTVRRVQTVLRCKTRFILLLGWLVSNFTESCSFLQQPQTVKSRKDLLAILSQKNTKEETEFLKKLIKWVQVLFFQKV